MELEKEQTSSTVKAVVCVGDQKEGAEPEKMLERADHSWNPNPLLEGPGVEGNESDVAFLPFTPTKKKNPIFVLICLFLKTNI